MRVRNGKPGRCVRHRWARLVVAAGVIGVLAPVAPLGGMAARAASGCLLNTASRNVWTRVPTPVGVVVVAMAQFDADPCVLLAAASSGAIFRSSDGGARWTGVGSVPVRPVAIETAGLPVGTAFVVPDLSGAGPTAPGLYVTRDSGATFAPVTGLGGLVVRAVAAVGVGSPEVMVAVAPPAPPAGEGLVLPVAATPTVYSSTNLGASFTPEPGSVGLDPTALVIDPSSASTVWVGSAGRGASLAGLFESTTSGASFTQQLAAPAPAVDAVAVSAEAGGGELILAATPNVLYEGVGGSGLYQGANGGNWQTVESGQSFSAVAFEYHHPFTFMAIGSHLVQRAVSAGSGYRFRTAQVGLPTGCSPDSLGRDTSIPSTFLLHCGAGLGGYYRYRSDGSDLGGADNSFPPPGFLPTLPVGGSVTGIPMQLLRTLRIPGAGRLSSGSVAFDGRWLYFADENGAGVLYRMSPTGVYGGLIQLPVRAPLAEVTYDPLRNLLYLTDVQANVWSYDLTSGATRFMFVSPVASCGDSTDNDGDGCDDTDNDNDGGGGLGTFSYDPSIDRFIATGDQGVGTGAAPVEEFTRTGAVDPSSVCYIPDVPAANPTGQNSDLDVGALGATGDGQMYVVMEDNTTIYRADRSCHVLATYSHAATQEPSDENQTIACDTVTFGVPAIWIRDSAQDVVQAFEIPNGYCALPTRLAFAPRIVVAAGHSAQVCATLRLTGVGTPLSGQQVNLFLSNRPLGVATTDQAGRACLVYRAAQPPVLPVPGPGRFVRRPTALAQPLVISRPVLGVFDGTLAYRPSAARSNLVTIVASPPPSAPVPAPAAPARAVVALLLAPAAPPAPPAPPAATKVLQSVTQANPGPQPGAVGQPGAAADRQDEVESAAQTATQNLDQVAPAADTNLYRELGGASGTAPAALAGFVLAAAVLERRRRRSRVQEQTIV